jgi:hypothetical protein
MLDIGFNFILFLGISISLYFIYKELETMREKIFKLENKLGNETELSIIKNDNIIEIFSNNDSKQKSNYSIPEVSLNFEKYITPENSQNSDNLNIDLKELIKKNKPEIIKIAEKMNIMIKQENGKDKTKNQLLDDIKKNLN